MTVRQKIQLMNGVAVIILLILTYGIAFELDVQPGTRVILAGLLGLVIGRISGWVEGWIIKGK